MEKLNRDRLEELFVIREECRTEFGLHSYEAGFVSGQIEEFCKQNAIDEDDLGGAHAEWIAARAV